MAEAEGAEGPDGSIRIRVKQVELGAMLGVTRESVNKELQNFARSGWVRTSRGGVSILDLPALKGFNGG